MLGSPQDKERPLLGSPTARSPHPEGETGTKSHSLRLKPRDLRIKGWALPAGLPRSGFSPLRPHARPSSRASTAKETGKQSLSTVTRRSERTVCKLGSPSTRGPSHCLPLGALYSAPAPCLPTPPWVPVTLPPTGDRAPWSVTPFPTNSPLDSNFGACVEFSPRSPKGPSPSLGAGLSPPHSEAFALSCLARAGSGGRGKRAQQTAGPTHSGARVALRAIRRRFEML